MSNLASTIQDLASNPKHTRWIGPLIISGEAVLCALIIWKVPCKPTSGFPQRSNAVFHVRTTTDSLPALQIPRLTGPPTRLRSTHFSTEREITPKSPVPLGP